MSRHIHIHLHDRRTARDMPVYIDVPEAEFGKYKVGGEYEFGGRMSGKHKAKVLGKRRGPLSGNPQLMIEYRDKR